MIHRKVWKLGDDINTDLIIAGRYLDNPSSEFLAEHVMEDLDPDFAARINKEYVIVAGRNFGMGSSREQAVTALRASGINIIIAESFARIFYRNAVNLGVLPIICPGCSEKLKCDEEIIIDVDAGIIARVTESEKTLTFQTPSPMILNIFEASGLINLMKSKIRNTNMDK